MSRVKSFWADHEKTLNFAVRPYRKHKKEIDQQKKRAKFEEPFSMRGVATK